MSSDYLIFGGSGFIGTHLSSYLEDVRSSFLIADIIKPRKQDHNYNFCDVRQKISLDIENNAETIIVNLVLHFLIARLRRLGFFLIIDDLNCHK